MATNAFELYWKGDFQVRLENTDVAGSKFYNNPTALSFMNRAFEIFYQCCRGINNCSDSKMKKKMRTELEKAATSGYGLRECDDLKEAIKHVTENKTKYGFNSGFSWLNDKSETYTCVKYHRKMYYNPYESRKPTIWQDGNVTSAKAAVKFMQAMDTRIYTLLALSGQFDKQWKQAHYKGISIYKKGTKADSDWNALGKTLQGIKSIVDTSQDYMWLMPAKLDKKFQKIAPGFGTAGKFLGIAERIYNLSTSFLQGVSTGKGLENFMFNALKDVLGLLPILGSFYAGALDIIPAAGKWMDHIYTSRWDEWKRIEAQTKHTMGDRQNVLSRAYASRSGPLRGPSRQMGPIGYS